jgi:V-type H+-transporting ATPase proteolipid subunit
LYTKITCNSYCLAVGAAYATALSSEGIATTWTQYPKFGMRALVPVVMAGIISIYGLVVGVIVGEKLKSSAEGYTIHMFVSLGCCAMLLSLIITGVRHTLVLV